jgi:hypothetical protein
MSQVNITLNTNTIDVNTTNNQIVVTDPTNPTAVNVVQPVTQLVEVITSGPQGPPGDPSSLTGSFVSISSFQDFTSSYYQDSSSFDTRIDSLEQFSSSLDATFATDAELNQATASLSSSISSLSSSFESFTDTYNTGSFTGTFSGSFSGSGANLFNIPASGIVGLNLSQISSGSVSASISPNNGLQVNTNVTATSFTGSFTGDGSGLTDLPISQLIREEFTWTSGSSQTFQLLSTASQVYTVEVQGQGALSTTQYDRPTLNSVRILDTLENGDYLTVLYSTTVVGVDPYYTQGQIDTLVGNKVDKVTTSGVERFYTINADGSQAVKNTSDIFSVWWSTTFNPVASQNWYRMVRSVGTWLSTSFETEPLATFNPSLGLYAFDGRVPKHIIGSNSKVSEVSIGVNLNTNGETIRIVCLAFKINPSNGVVFNQTPIFDTTIINSLGLNTTVVSPIFNSSYQLSKGDFITFFLFNNNTAVTARTLFINLQLNKI